MARSPLDHVEWGSAFEGEGHERRPERMRAETLDACRSEPAHDDAVDGAF